VSHNTTSLGRLFQILTALLVKQVLAQVCDHYFLPYFLPNHESEGKRQHDHFRLIREMCNFCLIWIKQISDFFLSASWHLAFSSFTSFNSCQFIVKQSSYFNLGYVLRCSICRHVVSHLLDNEGLFASSGIDFYRVAKWKMLYSVIVYVALQQWFLTGGPGTPWGSHTPILGVPNANLEYQQISPIIFASHSQQHSHWISSDEK